MIMAEEHMGRTGRYPCRNCGVTVQVGDLLEVAGIPAARYHQFAEDPMLPCGPVACDACGEVCFEPWAEDARYPMCMGCAHVCSHKIELHAAWVNWNPDPLVHAFGTVMETARRRMVLALCRVTVREPHGEFDPGDPKACPDCAEFVRRRLTFKQASAITDERIRARMADPNVIVCRRG